MLYAGWMGCLKTQTKNGHFCQLPGWELSQLDFGFPNRNSPTPLVASSRSGEQGWKVFLFGISFSSIGIKSQHIQWLNFANKKIMYSPVNTEFKPLKILIFPGKYLQHGGFPAAILVCKSAKSHDRSTQQHFRTKQKNPRRHLHGIPIQNVPCRFRNLSLKRFPWCLLMENLYLFSGVDPFHKKLSGSPAVVCYQKYWQSPWGKQIWHIS